MFTHKLAKKINKYILYKLMYQTLNNKIKKLAFIEKITKFTHSADFKYITIFIGQSESV